MVFVAEYIPGEKEGELGFLTYKDELERNVMIPLRDYGKLGELILPRAVGDGLLREYKAVPLEEALKIAEERGGDFIYKTGWDSYVVVAHVRKLNRRPRSNTKRARERELVNAL